jgi:hypothetical protein
MKWTSDLLSAATTFPYHAPLVQADVPLQPAPVATGQDSQPFFYDRLSHSGDVK